MGEPLVQALVFAEGDHYFSLSTRTFCWLFYSTMGAFCFICRLSFLREGMGFYWCHFRLP